MHRRNMLKATLGAGVAALAAPMMSFGSLQLFASSPAKYSILTVDLVQRSTVIDMLNPLSLYAVMAEFMENHTPTWFKSTVNWKNCR